MTSADKPSSRVADAMERVADAVETAAVVETDRIIRADEVETVRSDMAEALEVERSERAELVESARKELAEILEADRKAHNLRMEKQWKVRTKIVNRRFWFLFLALTLAFIFLAWRTEVTNQALKDGFYNACMARVNTTIEYNKGREALIQLVISAPENQSRTPEEIETITKQLRDGLLLPVDTCTEL